MIGQIVSALAGQQLAKTVGGAAAGPLGAVVGLALPMVARRLGPVGMVGMAAAAWVVSRAVSRPAAVSEASVPPAARAPVVTPPPVPMVMPD